ncbi:hypothetical protein ALT_8256 [Aspergillus lentulus]|uniref:Uncharacterized protein n=1 Tax=Aspergillus lentulus TaxID=293939 RepID=A0AAN4PQJ4_ASPLE|nr:uncharacterized protein IFM58399_08793 [Aspergillus lentulus]KAF4165082.1 hypothetical protein CNMCM6936_008344 [Aspergillus lentulus]KAF4183328.1 hypothetical protein CNMCM7927_009089 [Aspergillus lentulus]GAQ10935.1 hypothetical protein ALT_8256 [Aspergillus lentulus]GFF50379.1 hypothetical protein IFM58399_08793 [Aspergillus lentulus]GFF53152.1 hypothetical protein IFM62136_02242 [Aspergillus lentulus]
MYTLQSSSPFVCSPEPSIASSALLRSLSRGVSASIPSSTAPKGIRSWPKDRWDSIYNFFKDKLHIQQLGLREDDRLKVELSDEVDISDDAKRLDFTIASVESTKHRSLAGMETRAESTKLHRLASKTHGTRMPPAVYKRTASSTVDSVTPTPSHKSFLKHWSYKKSSIAAAVIFIVITTVAFIALSVLLFRRLRRSWKQYKKGKRDFANSKYAAISPLDDNIANYSFGSTPKIRRSRELSISDKSRPITKTYVAEEATRLEAVTRALCAHADAVPVSPLGSFAAPKQSEASLPQASMPERPGKSELPAEPWRAGFVPKQVVVVSPLNRMVSGKAAEIGWQSSLRTIDELSLPKPEAGPPRPHRKARREVRNSTPSTDQPFRLPSIERSTSPLFEF